MTQGICGRGLLLCAGIVVLLSPLPQRASAEQPPALPVRAGVIGIRLESNKAVYRVGEPIRLRVTLVNYTREQFWIGLSPPWMVCRLSISPPQPVRVMRNSLAIEGGDAGYSLHPGGSVTAISWPGASDPPEAWTNIKYWSYDLDKPGDYVIVGYPTVDAEELRGDHLGKPFAVSRKETSNTLHIKIVK